MSLIQRLPVPKNASTHEDLRAAPVRSKIESTALVSAQASAPPYGERKNWVPRKDSDFGDGGAFPEIHMAQYPLGLGAPENVGKKSNALAVRLDETGRVKYDAIARQGHGKDKIVYTMTQLMPREVFSENQAELERPNEEAVAEATEETRLALERLIQQKVSAALPVRHAQKSEPAQYIRYTPAQQGEQFNSGAKQRVIRMVEAQVDPMEPPRFTINKKIPRGPPSPPAPVMHSPTRKITAKEQKEWKIPPCISNWKNAKGYTIPLDKRLAADGRGLQQTHINEKFAKMAEALYIADRKAREAVEARAQLEKKRAQKEKEKKEEQLRKVAQQAREKRAGLRPIADEPLAALEPEAREREEIRAERHKERQRERNIMRAAPEKRSKLQRERQRDISEQIALGVPAKSVNTGETLFDQRLFNTTKGMDTGYGDDESYNVYDKPWRESASLASHLYRPSKQVDDDIYGEDVERLANAKRFVPDKPFAGSSRTGTSGASSSGATQRSGPVQFEKEEDPFGLDQFLNEAKKAPKRAGLEVRDAERKRRRNS